MTIDFFQKIKDEAVRLEHERLSKVACRSSDAIRRDPDDRAGIDHRLAFAIDADRILYSNGYARYIDKTQVFSLVPNDHITHRALHVQFLSKIARTIGNCLRLNTDLVEAIALGHDIGHPPFGHDGERMLSVISRKHTGKAFFHNLQSIRILERVEKMGYGLNLSLQVLDGVFCHNGEEDFYRTAPVSGRTFADLDRLLESAAVGCSGTDVQPCTLEGCLVKISDTVSYVGRDLEDAIILNLVARNELPEKVVRHLGDTAGKIVYSLVTDVIMTSSGKHFIGMSDETAEALQCLKDFNRDRIYGNPKIKTQHGKIGTMMGMMFDTFMEDFEKGNTSSSIHTDFLAGMRPEYLEGNAPAQIVIDYLASMTDRYFLETFKHRFIAETLPRYFS